jgi:DNA-binding NarL/FixJ family response regulator
MTSDMNNVVKVLIVDDHRMFSDTLNAVLEPEPGIRVLAQVFDSREAKAKIAECHPHVVLMDYNMPHLDGLSLTKLLLSESPELKILIVSMYNEEQLVESFRAVGARGYLFKTVAAEEVIRATLKVHAGEYYFPEESDTSSDAHENLLKKLRLSDREMEVVHLMKMGLKTKEIATKLHISFYTAEAHRNNIKLKMGVKTEADFIKFISRMQV